MEKLFDDNHEASGTLRKTAISKSGGLWRVEKEENNSTQTTSINWKDSRINIIDTPDTDLRQKLKYYIWLMEHYC